MTNPPRILHVIYSLDPSEGGMCEGLRQICRAHARLGHDAEVVTLDAPHATWLSDFPSEVNALGPVIGRYGFSPKLTQWISERAERYSAVVVHGLWQFHGVATRRALAGSRTPYFVFPHGMLDPWFKHAQPFKHLKKRIYWQLFERHVLQDAGAILFTTDEEARLAPQSFVIDRCKTLIVGLGIDAPDIAKTQKDRFVQQWPECRGKRLVLFLSRIHEKKGCDLLISAFASARQRDPNLHLVMAGPDETGLRARLDAQAQALGVARHMTWTGMLTGEDKLAALEAAEVFTLFSHQENFGVAVVEALASGIPVLITHPINISRAIIAQGAGFADEDSVAGATRLLLRWLDTSADEKIEMRQRAVACFKALFHSDATTRCLVERITAQHVAMTTS